jgi:hypothetical protein
MRGIFLDFDGVVHPVSAIADWRTLNISSADLPHLVQSRQLLRWMPLLAKALEDHPDVVIVVHSGWRGVADNVQLRDFLGELGDRYMGVTSLDLRRHDGIQEVVLRAGLEHHLIIDDATHEFPTNCEHLLVTNPELGLSAEGVMGQLTDWLDRTAPSNASAPAMAA